MRALFVAGLLLGAELCGCGALVTLPPEPGDTPAPTYAGAPNVSPIMVATPSDAGLDALPVEASSGPEASTMSIKDAAVVDVAQPAPATSCPATPPNLGDPCALPDSGVLRCEYGIAGGPCSTLAYCDGQRWGLGELIPADASRCD